MRTNRRFRRFVLCPIALALPLAAAIPAVAQPEDAAATGHPAPDPAQLRAYHDMVATAPHRAGTAGDRKVVDALAATMRGFGLEVEVQALDLYLAEPVSGTLAIVAPEALDLPVREIPVEGDPFSAQEGLEPGWAAYSGSGAATGRVVYANYGRKEDFAKLDELGVDVEGAVVVARFGGNFRGFKAKFAEERGAAALVMYTDPADAGWTRGLTYPEGGWAHPTQVQRGSILTLPWTGDPLTPFEPALPDAERLDPSEIPLPKIPVQPVGWAAAQEILQRMTGAAVPRGWQGALPFTYRVEGGPGLRIRVAVEQRRRLVRTHNVVGTLPGAVEPERKVVVGSHHDAWIHGAGDPSSGTILVLEAARLLAERAAAGDRPARSILFAHWGAEEYGILGSVEWVEAHREDLAANAVAYLNLDGAAMGPEIAAAATPSLRPLLAEALGAVPAPPGAGPDSNPDSDPDSDPDSNPDSNPDSDHDPDPDGAAASVYDRWQERVDEPFGEDLAQFGTLGGGSDHVGFNCHLGIPAAGMYGGGSPGTAYHSAYDNLAWYRKVVGDDYAPAVALTAVVVRALDALASRPLLPYDPAFYGTDTAQQLERLAGRVEKEGFAGAGFAGFPVLRARAERLAARARAALDALRAAEREGTLTDAARARANAALIRIERAWIDPAGLPERPWFRSLLASSDADSGYAAWPLPALRHAVERRDAEGLKQAVERYSAVFDRLEAGVEDVAGAIGSTTKK